MSRFAKTHSAQFWKVGLFLELKARASEGASNFMSLTRWFPACKVYVYM